MREIANEISGVAGSAPTVDKTDFQSHMSSSLEAVDDKLKNAASMPEKLITGEINDFHEVAVQLRQADLSFRFAMEIRNKLIEAYREVMRMNV